LTFITDIPTYIPYLNVILGYKLIITLISDTLSNVLSRLKKKFFTPSVGLKCNDLLKYVTHINSFNYILRKLKLEFVTKIIVFNNLMLTSSFYIFNIV